MTGHDLDGHFQGFAADSIALPAKKPERLAGFY
jgi:hypothetical protein